VKTQVKSNQLATAFNRSGVDYKQLKRTGNIALYEVWNSGKVSFEVIIIRGEKYPTDMAFGVDAWQFKNIQDAEHCMRNEIYLAETE
jgi:hypothetical protein